MDTEVKSPIGLPASNSEDHSKESQYRRTNNRRSKGFCNSDGDSTMTFYSECSNKSNSIRKSSRPAPHIPYYSGFKCSLQKKSNLTKEKHPLQNRQEVKSKLSDKKSSSHDHQEDKSNSTEEKPRNQQENKRISKDHLLRPKHQVMITEQNKYKVLKNSSITGKRGRGRPRKYKNVEDVPPFGEKRGRGRPKGSLNKKKIISFDDDCLPLSIRIKNFTKESKSVPVKSRKQSLRLLQKSTTYQSGIFRDVLIKSEMDSSIIIKSDSFIPSPQTKERLQNSSNFTREGSRTTDGKNVTSNENKEDKDHQNQSAKILLKKKDLFRRNIKFCSQPASRGKKPRGRPKGSTKKRQNIGVKKCFVKMNTLSQKENCLSVDSPKDARVHYPTIGQVMSENSLEISKNLPLTMNEVINKEQKEKQQDSNSIVRNNTSVNETTSLWVSVRTDLFCIDTALKNGKTNLSKSTKSLKHSLNIADQTSPQSPSKKIRKTENHCFELTSQVKQNSLNVTNLPNGEIFVSTTKKGGSGTSSVDGNSQTHENRHTSMYDKALCSEPLNLTSEVDMPILENAKEIMSNIDHEMENIRHHQSSIIGGNISHKNKNQRSMLLTESTESSILKYTDNIMSIPEMPVLKHFTESGSVDPVATNSEPELDENREFVVPVINDATNTELSEDIRVGDKSVKEILNENTTNSDHLPSLVTVRDWFSGDTHESNNSSVSFESINKE